MPGHWSDAEVEAAVADYFRLVCLELTGHKYNKTEHRRALMAQLNHRSDGSVELKHQNIGARHFRDTAAVVDAGGPPDKAALAGVLPRDGLVPVARD